MPEDSIKIKVTVDTSDVETNLSDSVGKGVRKGTLEAIEKMGADIVKEYNNIMPDLTGAAGKNISKELKEQINDLNAAARALNTVSIAFQRTSKEEQTEKRRAFQREYQAKAQENKKEILREREASRKRIIDYQERRRAERATAPSMKGVLGGLLGYAVDTAISLKPSELAKSISDVIGFRKADYEAGKKFGPMARELDPDWTPQETATSGFRAGAEGIDKKDFLVGKLAPVVAAVAAIGFIFKKTVLDPTIKVGKKVVGYFVDIARQTETLQTLFNLIALPFKIIFTLGFIEPLLAFIPILKEMINWVTSNQEVIQKISDTLARVFTDVFTEDRIGFVSVLLDKFAGVLQFLADSLATNMETVNTSNVASFIASTITSVVGFIQDLLMGIVAFCYSPEGQTFVIKMAEGIGRLIGTLLDLFIAMLPIFLEMAIFTIIGIVEGVISTVWKAIANLFDIIDKATGGALTGFVNGIIAIANWVIDRINDVIDFLNNVPFINIGRLENVASWDSGSIGSNFGTAATNMWNSSNFYNSTTVTNYNSLSNSDTMRSLMMTGI